MQQREREQDVGMKTMQVACPLEPSSKVSSVAIYSQWDAPNSYAQDVALATLNG